jgi:hypothetical protein
MNPNFTRWVRASVEDFFNNSKGSTMMYFEEDPNRYTQGEGSYYEFRMDGPNISELSRGEFQVYLEVNILISAVISTDLHHIDDLIGRIQAAMLSGPIPVFRYGDPSNTENDGTFIDCLDLMQERKHDLLEVNRFGRIHQDVALRQATVEGHYKSIFSL